MAKKTFEKDGQKRSTSLPREQVTLRAAGWVEAKAPKRTPKTAVKAEPVEEKPTEKSTEKPTETNPEDNTSK